MPTLGNMHTAGFPIAGRLGEVGGDCFMLNVNLGSKSNPARNGGRGNFASQDMCMHQGQIYCVHIEGDKTLTTGIFGGTTPQRRGPYVQTWDGASWSLVGGGTLDPAADSSVAASGDRWNPRGCRIASDGTDLFVAYYDFVWDGDTSHYGKSHIRICHYSGGSWTEVASEPIQGGGDGSFGGSMISMTVHNGKAYCVYASNSYRQPRIFRSDGSGDFVPGFIPPADLYGGAVGAGDGCFGVCTTSGGRPVGISNYSIHDEVGYLVAFDLDTAAVIRKDNTTMGPSALVPYGTNGQGSNIIYLAGDAISGYGANQDQIAVLTQGSAHGILLYPEDFSTGPVAIDGSDAWKSSWGLAQFSRMCMDPLDPAHRSIFFSTGTAQDLIGFGLASYTTIRVWEPNPTYGGNVINPAPNYGVRYFVGGAFGGIPLDGYPDYCLYFNDFYWAIWGATPVATDGTYLYAFWCYCPGTDNGAAYDADGATPDTGNMMQWVVSRFPIVRSTPTLSSLATFHSRHKLVPA